MKKNILVTTAAAVVLLTGCISQTEQFKFDPRTCLEEIPGHVKGLKIVSGPRSEKSIIRDMVPVVCNGHMLFRNMNAKGKTVNAGHVLFKVLVEYTGEVYNVSLEDTTINSEEFLREVSDFIMDTDFTFWGLNTEETIFLYPVEFGQ
jgi:hypothetical protein